jgi:hypothetical protein
MSRLSRCPSALIPMMLLAAVAMFVLSGTTGCQRADQSGANETTGADPGAADLGEAAETPVAPEKFVNDAGEVIAVVFPSNANDAELQQLEGATALSAVTLRDAKISDTGLKQLSGLSSLQVIVLSGTNVSDQGLEHLTALTSLETLWLDGTQVTDAGKESLQAALPDCRIVGP